MPTEREVGLDPLLERGEAQLVEPLDGGARERLVGEVGERRPAPQAERLAEELRRRVLVVAARAPSRPRAASRSNRARSSALSSDAEQVAGRSRLERLGRAERAAELGDLPLHLRHRGDRRPPGVEVVGEPVDRHDAVRVQEQDRERRALPRPAEPDRAALAGRLERSQHAELEHARTVAGR